MDYKDLQIWQQGILLCENIYKITKKFPSEEKYNLTSQINKCAVSIPSNIAEGHGRISPKEFLRFCNISRGSLNELETQIIIANKLNLISDQDTKNIREKITILMKKLRAFQSKLSQQLITQ